MSIIMDLFRRSQEKNKKLNDDDFWEIIGTIDHEYGGDSEAVLSSLVRHLKNCEDEYIFAFDDKLSELIYALDGQKWADGLFADGEEFSEEKFLCARCAAVAAGAAHYSRVIGNREKLSSDNIHEYEGRWYGVTDGLMTAAADAWTRKHLKTVNEYPHTTKYSLKSHSNKELW